MLSEDVGWVSEGCLKNAWRVSVWYLSKPCYCQESNHVRTRAKRWICTMIFSHHHFSLKSSIFYHGVAEGGGLFGVWKMSEECLQYLEYLGHKLEASNYLFFFRFDARYTEY